MATDIDLNTVTREDAGTSHSRRMRRDGTVPAVVYGAGKDSIKVSISHNELLKKLNNEAFLNSILTIKVDDKEESVLIKDIQVHPSSCLLYTSPSPRDGLLSRMPSSA